MRQLLKTILLISVLAIFIAGCAEEKSKSGQTNTGQTDTGQTDTGQQTPTTAEQVLADFMTEFNAMQGVDIGQLTSSGNIYEATANITNTRKDNKDALFISMDGYLIVFSAGNLNEALIVEPTEQDLPGVLISANGNSNVTFRTSNNPPIGTRSSVCVLLTQEELLKFEQELIPQVAMPTGEQMQAIIDFIKPYVVKINYSVQ